MRTPGALTSTTTLALALSLALSSSATASARASVTLTAPAQATAGTPTVLSFTARRVPSSASLYLQRQQGTARKWRTVARLHGAHGSVSLPALGLGKYHIRVAAISNSKTHKLLAASARRLSVFGQVALSSIAARVSGTVDEGPGTFATATHTFSYFMKLGPPAGRFSFIGSSNNCRSIHLDFEFGDPQAQGQPPAPQSATLSIVQETADAVAVTVAPEELAALDASLVPGQSFSMQLAQPPAVFHTAFINGYASCTSDNPLLLS